MKRVIVIIWCLLFIFVTSACQKGEPSAQPESTSGTAASSPVADTATSSQSTESASTPKQKDSYKDITCEKVTAFQDVTFHESNSRTKIHIMFPKNWTLKKSDQGYSILQASKVVGSVTISDAAGSETTECVHSDKMTMSGVNITGNINRVTSEGDATYIRTISYQYKEADGNSRTVIITVPYQQIDDDAAWKMMVKTKKTTAPDPKMGVLPIADDRDRILILGNSFVGTSKIGSILQKMCGTSLSVEAQSRGYARVTTYVQDEGVMSRIRSGDYAAVILCGLYDLESVTNLEHIINACKSSDTNLAIFPAHNESSSLIGTAGMLHPSALFLDWKGEIDSFISSGIDQSHFCIADSHKHSTPLAGYVGAHMIYRAIFGKIPAEKSYSEVSKSEISLLGDYASTGLVSFSKPDATYPLKAG